GSRGPASPPPEGADHRRGRAVRDVRDSDRGRARARRERRESRSPLHLPRLLPALHERGGRAGEAARRPRPLPLGSRVRARRGAVGRAADPGAHGVLLPQRVARPRRCLLSEPGRRDRVGAAARRVAGARGEQSRPRDPGAGRGGASRPRTAGCAGIRLLHRPDRRLLRADRHRPEPLEGIRRRGGGMGGDRGLLRPAPPPMPRIPPGECTMSEFASAVLDARAEPYAAVPTLVFRLRAETAPVHTIHTLALRCQIRIEPQRRRYDTGEQARLEELFGTARRWGDTLKPFLWTHVSTLTRGFTGAGEVELAVPCTYDFEVVAAKYLHSLGDG